MFNWVYHLVPFYFKEKDSVHLTLAKKQISSFLHPRLRGEDGFSSKYPSTFAPSFLQKHFKNKVHESNLYEIGMRVPIHLVKKKHMKKGAYLGSDRRSYHGQRVNNTYYLTSFDKLATRIVSGRFQDKPSFINHYGKHEPTLFFNGGHFAT